MAGEDQLAWSRSEYLWDDDLASDLIIANLDSVYRRRDGHQRRQHLQSQWPRNRPTFPAIKAEGVRDRSHMSLTWNPPTRGASQPPGAHNGHRYGSVSHPPSTHDRRVRGVA